MCSPRKFESVTGGDVTTQDTLTVWLSLPVQEVSVIAQDENLCFSRFSRWYVETLQVQNIYLFQEFACCWLSVNSSLPLELPVSSKEKSPSSSLTTFCLKCKSGKVSHSLIKMNIKFHSQKTHSLLLPSPQPTRLSDSEHIFSSYASPSTFHSSAWLPMSIHYDLSILPEKSLSDLASSLSNSSPWKACLGC